MTRGKAVTLAVVAVSVTVGYAIAMAFRPHHVGRMLPWVLGRGLGIGAYVALTALTALGLWLRHPWRVRWRHPAPEALLRMHAMVAALTVVLLAGHMLALILDTYAGVGWTGAFVPTKATYRPLPVALGTVSLYLGLLVGSTAGLAGRLVGRAWLPVHKVAWVVFVLAWGHGMLAGSDAAALWWLYVATGGLVSALLVTRRLAPTGVAQQVGGAA